MDPAGPGFQTARNNSKLNSGDAKYVQCIYTDGDIFGTDTSFRPCDGNFIMGDGIDQPACDEKSISETDICDHSMAYKYFKYSLNKSVVFAGDECHVGNKRHRIDWIGIHSQQIKSTFCVKVNAEPPYARGNLKKNA